MLGGRNGHILCIVIELLQSNGNVREKRKVFEDATSRHANIISSLI